MDVSWKWRRYSIYSNSQLPILPRHQIPTHVYTCGYGHKQIEGYCNMIWLPTVQDDLKTVLHPHQTNKKKTAWSSGNAWPEHNARKPLPHPFWLPSNQATRGPFRIETVLSVTPHFKKKQNKVNTIPKLLHNSTNLLDFFVLKKNKTLHG